MSGAEILREEQRIRGALPTTSPVADLPGSQQNMMCQRQWEVQELWNMLSSDGVADRASKVAVLAHKMQTYLGGYKLKHFAEGRANVVFKALPRTLINDNAVGTAGGTEDEGIFAGALFRVPKTTPGVTAHNYLRLQQYHETVVEPAVGARFLVPQLLMDLNEARCAELNAERDPEGIDKARILPGHMMMIQDMTPVSSAGQIGVEFKPKWLTQSPVAPADAKRCRNCAREARRLSLQRAKTREKEHAKHTWKPEEQQQMMVPSPTPSPAPSPYIVCPLGLLNPDPVYVLHTIQIFAPDLSPAECARLRDAFERTGILKRLRDLQITGDKGDTMFTNPTSKGFGLAMTLRDCTCFVRMSRGKGCRHGTEGDGDDGIDDVEIKLADVDEKNAEQKKEYWQTSHLQLVKEGFYHKRESPRVDTRCVLEA